MRVVFCGTAPGAASARAGAYYAGPGNRFWATLPEVGLTPILLAPAEFPRLADFGIGLTDVSKTASDQSILDEAVLVDQTGARPSCLRVLSSSTARAVAVVDRTADVEAAARAITTARFCYGGRSPFAPDLVLVNEFVKKAFIEACSRYATLSFAGQSSIQKPSGSQDDEVKRTVREAERQGQASSFGSDDFKLVHVLDK